MFDDAYMHKGSKMKVAKRYSQKDRHGAVHSATRKPPQKRADLLSRIYRKRVKGYGG